MFKFVILAAAVAVANAGYLGAPAAVGYAGYASPYGYAGHGVAAPALVSQQSNILRTPGNLGQVSTYSKTINTPYSSVSKSDVRVSNDALAYAGHGYAAPLAYAAPVAKVAAPLAYAAPVAHAAYAAPVAHAAYAAPLGYAAPIAHAAPFGYAAPVAKVAAPVAYASPVAVAHAPAAIGVAYSAAPVVSHVSLDGLGAHYTY